MLQAPLNDVLIPAASLPRVLRGIRRGSVDAVSDTFRFLPFIFPPTQSTRHSCWWTLQKPAIFPNTEKKKEEDEDELWRQITAAWFMTNYKMHKWWKSCLFFLLLCVRELKKKEKWNSFFPLYCPCVLSGNQCMQMYINIHIHLIYMHNTL